MTKENLMKTIKSLRIVNLIKSKKGYVLVTQDKTKNEHFDYWLLVDVKKITEYDKNGDAHIGGYYIT